jgi:hypothetical protein
MGATETVLCFAGALGERASNQSFLSLVVGKETVLINTGQAGTEGRRRFRQVGCWETVNSTERKTCNLRT